ncbi:MULTISPECIES: hypothetical protein [Thermoanaerobacterium]|uniref:Uncharacterized protein n=2 Tax=Thermoanaerobacterium TaxID=28895 RepID=W9EDA6_9THEO|nr:MULTISPECIES: hypothetical protein [Thermoanaerobacterium]AFK86970.1 hypothetical protein Tsac_1966 [Thermoanaerobacterium saccharolyticum JW/SL-YS485]ETO39221.1 hypothetical protein V518_0539 [Thermoanaerobacterium aotearoense SCUT27]
MEQHESYWNYDNLLDKIKRKYRELNQWSEEKAFKYIQDKLHEIEEKHKGGDTFGIEWVEKHHQPLNRKHNEAIEKINRSFKVKDMTLLCNSMAEFEGVISEIVEACKKAKQLAEKYEVDINSIYWDEAQQAYVIKYNQK